MNVEPVVKGWKYDEYGNEYYEYEPDYYYNDDYYDPYEDDHQNFEWNDLEEGLPEYNMDDLNDDASWVDYAEYFKYIIDIAFIAIPWTIMAILCMGWNLWFNFAWNEKWAGGNFWLVFNTIYILGQGIGSIALAFELPIWLRFFRGLRFWSLVSAIMYTIVYAVNVFEWYDMLYIVTDKSQYDFVTIFINMCLGYNIVLHSSVIPINVFIVFKEISMEFFQFLRDDAGQDTDDISLGYDDWNDDYEYYWA